MEIWKPLRNFPSYDGSTEGRIKNIRTQRILKTYINEKGYEQVCLRRNNKQYTVKVGRVIAETFLGECPGMDIWYKDGNSLNNHVDNLAWRTRGETISSAFERGSKVPRHCTVIRVKETDEVYESVAECARQTGCDSASIFKCLAGTLPHVKGLHFERI